MTNYFYSIKKLAYSATGLLKGIIFPGSQKYWENRYSVGKTSGAGSYGIFAEFKAEVLNAFVNDHNISSVIEFGCGDGNQLTLAKYPHYIGLDVSKTAIKICKERFKDDNTKSFFLYDTNSFVENRSIFKAELALSLDVIFHLIEDDVYEIYMKQLFFSADKFVIIFSSDTDINKTIQLPHVKHRHFSKWIEKKLPEWDLIKKIPNTYQYKNHKLPKSLADFFIYQRKND